MRRAYALLVISLLPLGCVKWVASDARVGDVLAARRESVLRVRDTSSTRSVHTPYVRGDSLLGWTREATSPVNHRVAMHLADIEGVAVRRVSIGRTVLMALGLAVGTMAMLIMSAEPIAF